MGCHHLLLLKVGHGCVGKIKVHVNTTNQDLKYHRIKVNYQKNSVHLASLHWCHITSSHRLKTSGTTYFTLISIGHYKNICRNIGFKGWLHIFICCFWLSAYSTWNPQVKPIKIICNIQGYNIYSTHMKFGIWDHKTCVYLIYKTLMRFLTLVRLVIWDAIALIMTSL